MIVALENDTSTVSYLPLASHAYPPLDHFWHVASSPHSMAYPYSIRFTTSLLVESMNSFYSSSVADFSGIGLDLQYA